MSDRPPCPVLTCSEVLPPGQLLCLKCWDVLPGYARVAVIAGQRNAQNRPTAANKSKLEIAKKNAIAVAMGLRR